jgi:hypothetical protein
MQQAGEIGRESTIPLSCMDRTFVYQGTLGAICVSSRMIVIITGKKIPEVRIGHANDSH